MQFSIDLAKKIDLVHTLPKNPLNVALSFTAHDFTLIDNKSFANKSVTSCLKFAFTVFIPQLFFGPMIQLLLRAVSEAVQVFVPRPSQSAVLVECTSLVIPQLPN